MEFNVITITLLVSALLLIFIGAVLLIRFDWFKGWLVGSIGLSALTLALFFSIVILGFNSYVSSSQSDSVATISFQKIAPQHYKAELAETQGDKFVFELRGDFWEVDATILSWGDFFEKQGLKPYYRVDTIHSSYQKLVDAEKLPSSSVAIDSGLVDMVLKTLTLKKSLFLESSSASTGALPMADGALFSIRLNQAGLISKAENQQAFSAIR